MIYVIGPGHGGPGARGERLARGHLQRGLPLVSDDDATAWRGCSISSRFPGGIPSHVAPETPGSIHEGGELGYSLAHAFGAAFDNPGLLVACVVGDGEAETGPLAASWHSNKFLDPVARRRRAADPAPQRLQDRQPDRARPHPATTSSRAAARLRLRPDYRRGRRPGDDAPGDGRDARRRARDDIARHPARRAGEGARRPTALADDRAADAQGLDGARGGRRRAGRGHLARPPGAAGRGAHEPATTSRSWRRGCAATGPRSCSTTKGGRSPRSLRSRPTATARMSANPHANGGLLLRDLLMPDFRDYGVEVAEPGATSAEPTRVLGRVPARRHARHRAATTSGSSAPTRPRRTGSARSSRSRQGVAGRDRCRSTTIWRPRAG